MINAALEIPDYDPSKDIQAAKAAFEPLIAQAEELAAFSEKRLKEIDAELKTIQQEKVRLVLRLCIESRVSCTIQEVCCLLQVWQTEVQHFLIIPWEAKTLG